MFIGTLFTVAKTWKHLKHPLTEKWIKKMWYTDTMDYYSATKKNKTMPFATTWMDPEIVILGEVSQRRKNILWYLLYVESKKKWYKWTYLKNRNRLTDLENKLVVASGKAGGRNSLGVWDGYVHTARTSCIVHGTLLNVMWQPGGRSVWGKTDTCLCVTETSLFTWNYHNIVLYPNTKEMLKKRLNVFLFHHLLVCAQSYPALCDPMDCSPSASSIHGILQARILEWVFIFSSSGSSGPRDRTHVSCIGRWILYHGIIWEAPIPSYTLVYCSNHST